MENNYGEPYDNGEENLDIELYESYPENYDDDMDGDHQSALSSAGFGTDEDYGTFSSGEDEMYGNDGQGNYSEE